MRAPLRSRVLKSVAVAAALVLAAAGGSVVASTTVSPTKVCVNKKTGAMRQEMSGKRCNAAVENRLTINQQGVKGDTGAAGAAGARGPAGVDGASGLSKAYFRLLDADFNLSTTASTVVGRISDVPAGSYMVFFDTDVMNWGIPQYFGCGFETQGGSAAKKIWIPEEGGILLESRWSYSKNGLVTVPEGGGTIEIQCKINDTPTDMFNLSNGSLIAIAVNEVTSSARIWNNP